MRGSDLKNEESTGREAELRQFGSHVEWGWKHKDWK
jgi:hypothetical protein